MDTFGDRVDGKPFFQEVHEDNAIHARSLDGRPDTGVLAGVVTVEAGRELHIQSVCCYSGELAMRRMVLCGLGWNA